MGDVAALAAGVDVDEALQMYLSGYTLEEIYDAIGVDKSWYKPLITEDIRKEHRKAYQARKLWEDFRYKWDDARRAALNSGRDLSKILIVPK